ncbi:MAG TPA: hypothetical protein VNA20_06275 [Frankiaceae bacterium]|nr:hypothetical protein [Frankiaceae bacterium]
MRTALPNAARDTVAPTLHKAQDTLTETVLPAVRDALAVLAERGNDLLDSDVTTEARRRGKAVVKAAKGEVIVPSPARRWRFGLGMLAAGAALGVAIATVLKKLSGPVDSYATTSPVPSGTDGGVTTGTDTAETTLTGGGIDGVTTGSGGKTTASPPGTAVDDIDLRSGAPTNV